jgi:DNA-binding MarR family transcriptional regulator
MMTDPLRDKDHLVLSQIAKGHDDVQKVTSATTLENHHVTYALDKLEDLGLVNVSKPEGMVERVIDGQKRVFQAPKQAELTEKGKKYLEQADRVEIEGYENMSHRELVEKVHQLEKKVEQIDRKTDTFRRQILEKIE